MRRSIRCLVVTALAAALAAAYDRAGPNDLICATGSIIFIGDLLNQWDSLQSELTVESEHAGYP